VTKQVEKPPTRLLFVGGRDADEVKLVQLTSPVEYIALSHRWGDPSPTDKEKYSTSDANYEARLGGFRFSNLPKTFQDAVLVTRELGKQYLWIDSLCIIQGDESDWDRESKRMQDVFASAYCTIAASSATGWDEGFLQPKSGHSSLQHIFERQLFASDNVHFENDVEKAQLNQRGWVIQERVLSRRIIHFTEKHTYWECGEGVRCENSTKMNCPAGRHRFLLDPRFPERLKISGYYRSLDFLQFLFQKYAKCGLTRPSDRKRAIGSLMRRMEVVFETRYRCGTFQLFLHRLLLWYRGIPENEHKHYEHELPSWSWMIYSDIIFPDISKLEIADLQYDDDTEDSLLVQVRAFKNCRVNPEKSLYWILNDKSEKIGEVWFDETDSHFEHCVVVGMEYGLAVADADRTYWVLVVKTKESGFKRVGVGKIKALYVSKEGDHGTLV